MNIPAFCNTCAAVFRSGFASGDSPIETYSGISKGPCPVCGGIGRVAVDVFSFLGNTIEILSAPQRTKDELTSLAAILTEACGNRRSSDQVVEKINAEVPELTGLANLFPKTEPEIYSFLTLTVAAIALLLQGSSDGDGATNVTVEQTIDHILIETDNLAVSRGGQFGQTPRRNEACPCGSGRKYKQCHGQLA